MMAFATNQDAIDKLSMIILMLRKFGYPELAEQLDEIRQWMGRDL